MSDVPPVSALADVLSLRHLGGWLTPPLVPVVPAPQPIAGRVRTLALRADPAGKGLTALYDLLSEPLDGTVLLLGATSGSGLSGVGGALWGEILSRAGAARNAVAALLDAPVRDQAAMAAEGLPVYATGTAAVGPAGRVSVVSVDVPVTIGGFTVAPGDTVVVDSGGAVRVPAADAASVLDDARAYAAAEEQVLASLAAGRTLSEAYRPKQEVVERLRRAAEGR